MCIEAMCLSKINFVLKRKFKLSKDHKFLKVCHPRYVRSITHSCSVYISIYT